MPRGRVMRPGFGNLSLGLPPPGGGRPYAAPYQEGTGLKPPVPVAPLPPAGQVAGQVAGAVPVAPDQALAARAGVPAQAVQTPEQMGVADQSRQAAVAVRPAGYVKSDPLAYGAPRVELPLPLKPLMPSPVDMVTAQAAGRPMLQPMSLTPGPEQQWGMVAPGRRPEDMIPVAPLPVPGAGVQVPMRNPAVPVPAPVTPAEQAGPAGPVMDEQRGRMTITPDDIEGLSRYGSERDRKELQRLAPRAQAGNAEAQAQYTAIKNRLEGIQGEQQEKEAAGRRKQEADALGADLDILKGDEAEAQKAVDRLRKESADRDVGADLELAEQRLRAAKEATRGVMTRRAEALRPPGAKRLPVGPAPVTGAKAGALALEALGIKIGPAVKGQPPQSKKDAQAAARVGAEVVGKLGRAVEDSIVGRRMRVPVDIDRVTGNAIYADAPDPRHPGLFDGTRLTYDNIKAAEEALRTGFGETTGGVGKQEADLEVTRKAALVSWLARNRHRPEMQEGISEWARKNKADWERIAGSIPVMDPAAPAGERRPGEQTIAGMKLETGEVAPRGPGASVPGGPVPMAGAQRVPAGKLDRQQALELVRKHGGDKDAARAEARYLGLAF
ncbi:MAG: hypothetical protein WC789_09235 [Lentisphaeria bacterium]